MPVDRKGEHPWGDAAQLLLNVLFLAVWLYDSFIRFYHFSARFEERVMERKFGDEYRRYKSGTGKWLPRPGG